MKPSRSPMLASLFLSAVSAILLAVACATAYDPAVSNYFPAGSPLLVSASVLSILAIISGIVSAILIKAKNEPFEAPSAPSFAVLPSAIGSLITSVMLFIGGKVWIGILFLLATAFYALSACPFAKKYAPWVILPGFAVIAATIALTATFYFDMTVEMNAPVKVLLQLGLLSVMLESTLEIRALIGRESPVLFGVVITFAAVLCPLSGISGLVLVIASKTPGIVYSAAVPVILGGYATAIARLISALFPRRPAQTRSESSEINTDEGRTAE